MDPITSFNLIKNFCLFYVCICVDMNDFILWFISRLIALIRFQYPTFHQVKNARTTSVTLALILTCSDVSNYPGLLFKYFSTRQSFFLILPGTVPLDLTPPNKKRTMRVLLPYQIREANPFSKVCL